MALSFNVVCHSVDVEVSQEKVTLPNTGAPVIQHVGKISAVFRTASGPHAQFEFQHADPASLGAKVTFEEEPVAVGEPRMKAVLSGLEKGAKATITLALDAVAPPPVAAPAQPTPQPASAAPTAA